jgi:mRNA interferase RelE/StbE
MNIIFSKSAIKAIERMDAYTKKRIQQGIYNLPTGDVKKLQGYSAAFRLRIGDWRILFEMLPGEIRINDVLPRGDAYKGVKK